MESDDDYLYEATDSGNVSPEEDDSDDMVSIFDIKKNPRTSEVENPREFWLFCLHFDTCT